MTIARLIAGRDQHIVSCTPNHTVREAARLLSERRIGALPVLEDGPVLENGPVLEDGPALDGRVGGIFSERDLLHCIALHGEAALGLAVSEVMTAPPIAVEPETTVLDALGLMTRRRIRHLPVLAGGRLTAFVSIGDLVKYRIEMIEGEAEVMRDYIRTA